MKKLFSIALIGSFALLLAGCQFGGNKGSISALEFNDGIVDLQMDIVTPMMHILKFEGENLTTELKSTIATTENCIDSLKNMDVYPGGEQLQETALDLFGFYLRSMKGSWMDACVLYDDKKGDMTQEDVNHFQELVSAPAEEEPPYDKAFGNAQKAFVAANNLELERNELQDEIDGKK